jgi:hypothetical protein
MAGEITHVWHGTILTITSDSGTSSMDLKGEKGDDGVRGPQGPCGIIVNDDGTIDFSHYATEDYVNYQIDNIDFDLSSYATTAYVNNATATTQAACERYTRTQIAQAQVAAAGVDLSDYALKTEVTTMINEALGVIENGSY